MDYESPFLIGSPEQIINHLFILLKNKCLLTVCFGDDDDSFITTLLEINKKDNVFIFHHGPKEDALEQLLDSPKITFKTVCLGVEVVFDTLRLVKTHHQGVSVFAAPLPASMLWMERREFHRVKSPVSKSSYCRLTLKGQKTVSLKLYDISVAGFSMLTDAKEISDLTGLYTAFEHCKLILADADAGEDTVSFEIRSKYIMNPESPDRTEKIGCKFTQITPAFETAIQRYMQQIERENRQKN
jgi:c-di-GMP-binding flagellar brake protein YcgR